MCVESQAPSQAAVRTEQQKRADKIRMILSGKGWDRAQVAHWIQAPVRLAAINSGIGYSAVLASAEGAC